MKTTFWFILLHWKKKAIIEVTNSIKKAWEYGLWRKHCSSQSKYYQRRDLESEVKHDMATKINWSTNIKICKLSTSWFLLGNIAWVYWVQWQLNVSEIELISLSLRIIPTKKILANLLKAEGMRDYSIKQLIFWSHRKVKTGAFKALIKK